MTTVLSNAIPSVEHTVVKPEKLAEAAVVALEGNVVLPNLIGRESFDGYKGAFGDAVNFTVEGVLPWHNYAWRNDRSQPVEFDTYAERKISITLGNTLYSAVALTDEQYAMDFAGWGKLVTKQGEAVGRGLEFSAAAYFNDDANYDLAMAVESGASIREALVKARQIARKIHTPGNLTLLVGADWEMAINLDKDLTLAQNVGDSRADTAVSEATIGRLMGFNVVVSDEVAPGEAVVLGDNPFIMAQAAPAVPQSVGFGAVGSYRGFSTRLVQSYNHHYTQDESVLNAWYGFRTVRDPLLAVSDAGVASVSATEYQVRAFKLALDGTAKFPAAAEFADATNLTAADMTVAAPVEPEPAP